MENRAGIITDDYDDYNINEHIGKGGFAKVFKHDVRSKTFAVKEEAKSVSLAF